MCLTHHIHPGVQTLLAETLRCRDCRTGDERPGRETAKVPEQGAPRSRGLTTMPRDYLRSMRLQTHRVMR